MSTTAYDMLDLATEAKLHRRIHDWLVALEADYSGKRPDSTSRYEFNQMAFGVRYSRIVMLIDGKTSSVHAFIDKQGNVYKAASWKAPAKGVRFNLLDDESFERMLSILNWAGSYLYVR